MDKIKTLKKHETYLEKLSSLDLNKIHGVSRERPLIHLTDEKKMGQAILECLKNNDPEGVMEMIAIYLNALNKAKLREKGNLPKSTLYHSLKNKNPTIKTLAKLVYSYTHVV